MHVFITGASGFIGRAVVAELLAAGHSVLGLARSDAAATALSAAGAVPHRGSLEDLDSLRRGAALADGVIHLAFVHDFAQLAVSSAIDVAAIEAMGEVLRGSGRPFVGTSAIGVLAPGATEADAPNPGSHAHRHGSERVLELQGVRASVVRLPPSVHDVGDPWFITGLMRVAREKGVSAHIGDGTNRWPAVHRLDAARLYRLVLERGAGRFHGVAEPAIPTRDIAAAIGRKLDLPVGSVPADAARAHFGWLARFWGTDMPSTSERTRADLGWEPVGPGLLADVERNYPV